MQIFWRLVCSYITAKRNKRKGSNRGIFPPWIQAPRPAFFTLFPGPGKNIHFYFSLP